MDYTKEQFTKLGEFHFDDLYLNLNLIDDKLKLFNLLPCRIQELAIMWGLNDTEFRDEVFKFMVKNQFDMSIEDYYNSDIFKNGVPKDIDYSKLR